MTWRCWHSSITAPWVSWRPDRYSSETDYGELRSPLRPSGHYMYHTVVTVCTASSTGGTYYILHSPTLRSAHTAVFMCFVWISEQTAIINWLVFVTEAESVYCAVRTGFFTIPQVTLTFNELMTLATEDRNKGTCKPTNNIRRRSHTT